MLWLQYPKIFGTTRIPLPKRDKTVFCEDSKHIVVMSRGLIYSFHVFDANMEMSLTREMLAETLREIREDSGTEEAEDRMHNAVGVLTSDDREVRAGASDQFITPTYSPPPKKQTHTLTLLLNNAGVGTLAQASRG